MSEELRLGSVSISTEMHTFLSGLVHSNSSEAHEDLPFTAIVEAFRFAFALGVKMNQRDVSTQGSGRETIAPRQFIVQEYQDLLLPIANEENLTLGKVASEFAEAGARAMHAHVTSTGGSVFQLVGVDEA